MVSQWHRFYPVRCPLLNSCVLEGFYGVTYSLGFRDDFDPSTDDIIRYVSEIEVRADPPNAIRIIAETKWLASRTTHM